MNTNNNLNNDNWEEEEKKLESDRSIAISIMRSLVNSSYAEELKYYKEPVQDHLRLDEETMNRLFDLSTLVNLLIPSPVSKRYFQGKRVPPLYAKPSLIRRNDNPLLFVSRKRFRHTLPEEGPITLSEEKVSHELFRAPSSIIETPELENNETVPLEVVPEVVPEAVVEKPTEKEVETKHDETDETEDSKDADVANMISLLTDNDIDTSNLEFDAETYTKAILVKGNLKEHREILSKIGGKWNGKLQSWVFSKKRVNRRVRQIFQQTEEPSVDEAAQSVVERVTEESSHSDD